MENFKATQKKLMKKIESRYEFAKITNQQNWVIKFYCKLSNEVLLLFIAAAKVL